MFNNNSSNENRYNDPPPSYMPSLPDSNTTSFGTNDQNITNGYANPPIPTSTDVPVNMYEQMMIQRQELYKQQQEYRQKMLEQHYPVKFVIGHAVIVGAICVTLIVLQIIMIINQYPMYYVGQGIWVAAYFIIPISLELLLSKLLIFFKLPY